MKGRIYIHVIDDNSGDPVADARVSVYIGQFMASGIKDCGRTNSNGTVSVDLDIDNGAYIMLYANGTEDDEKIYPEDDGNYTIYI